MRRLFLLSVVVVLGLLAKTTVAFGAEAVVNICGLSANINGVRGRSTCWASCWSDNGREGFCSDPTIGGYDTYIDINACDSDSGDWSKCDGSNGGYGLANFNSNGGTISTNSYKSFNGNHCKVQFDIYRDSGSGRQLTDFLVWRDPNNCPSTPSNPNPGSPPQNPNTGSSTGGCGNIEAQANVNGGGWTANDVQVYYGDSVGANFARTGSGTVFFQNYQGLTGRQCSSDPGGGASCPMTVTIDSWWGPPGSSANIRAIEFEGEWWRQRGDCADDLRVRILGNRPPPPNRPPSTPNRWGTDIGYNSWTSSSSLQMGLQSSDPDNNISNVYFNIQYFHPNNNLWYDYTSNWGSNLGYFTTNGGARVDTYTTTSFPDGVYRYRGYGLDSTGAQSGWSQFFGNLYRDGTGPGSWTNLTDGGTYSGTVTVTVSGNDRWNPYNWGENWNGSWPYQNGSGLDCLYLSIDGSSWSASWCGVGDNGSRTFSWDTTQIAAGTHRFRTYAVDRAGNGRWWEDKTVTVRQGGSLSGTVFVDANEDGFKDAAEGYSNSATISITKSGGGTTAGTLSNGTYSFSDLDAGEYRLEIQPNFGWNATKWSTGSESFSYGVSGSSLYTKKLSDDYPFEITNPTSFNFLSEVEAATLITANLGIKERPTSGLTVELYEDPGLDGVSGDRLLRNVAVEFDCSPVGGPCQQNIPIDQSSGKIILSGLITGETYTLSYDKLASGYEIVTDIRRPDGSDCTNGAPLPKPASCTFNLSDPSGVVLFGVTNGTLPWIQVWDGDVYSHSSNITQEGIRITVNGQATSPYRPVFIQNGSAAAGGIAIARKETFDPGVSCGGLACSERGWVVGDYPSGIAWPEALDKITSSNPTGNVFYLSENPFTIKGSNKDRFRPGGDLYRKVVVTSGDLVIETTGVATGGADPSLSAFLVAKGKITISGPSQANELIMAGGLYAKDYFIFDYSLNDNRKPFFVLKYDPTILTQSTSLSQPSYTWREVSP